MAAWRAGVLVPGLLPAFAVVVLLGLFAAPSMALAQSERVWAEVRLAPEPRYLGEPIAMEIVVHGTRNAAAPEGLTINGCDVEYHGTQDRSSSMTTIINGKVTSHTDTTIVFSYSLLAKQAGTLSIPPINVEANGQTYATKPLTIRVQEPSVDPAFRIEVALEATDVFIGQPVAATITWYLGKQIKGLQYSLPIPEGAADLEPGPDPRPPASRRLPGDNRFFEVPINGQKAIAELGHTTADGQSVETLTVKLVLIPRRAGPLIIGPARVDYNAVIGQRQRQFMDSMFDDLSIVQRQYATTGPISLTVSPLPTQGRPAAFSGLVGRYAITARATPTEVSVGEPIDLDVTVTGPHPLSLVPPLDLYAQLNPHQGDQQLRLSREPALASVDGAAARFTTSVRARSVAVKEIPAISLPYFDPFERRYKTAASQPIALKVTPSLTIGAGGDDRADDELLSGADQAKRAPLPLPPGMADIDRTEKLVSYPFAARLERALRRWDSPMVLGTLFGAPAVSLASSSLLLLARQRRLRSNSDRHRRNRAYRIARRELNRVPRGDLVSAGGVLARYLNDRLGLPTASTTGQEIFAAARPMLSATSRASLKGLLTLADRRFDANGTSSNPGQLVACSDPGLLLRTIDIELRNVSLAAPGAQESGEAA